MNYLKKNFLALASLSLLTFVSLIPAMTFAQANDGKLVNPLNNITSIDGFVQTILVGALKIGMPVIALAIIYCGFLFVSARGNSEKIGEAKDALMYTLIGAAILLGAWALALLIKNTVLAL